MNEARVGLIAVSGVGVSYLAATQYPADEVTRRRRRDLETSRAGRAAP